ncbi:hypothetical protein JW766_03430 [Candidatus Dojkabacteria bacterium]|nr:hypothetical protein [Candidatus Dojkabacteria bacterium]
MKFLFSEFQPNYSNYYFPYQVYLVKEELDKIDKIYSLGFLPSRMRLNLFYLARSLRVNLTNFKPSSENRRISRKTEYLTMKVLDLSEFEYHYSIGKMGKDFYKERFGEGTMSAFRIKWLFTKGACSHVLVFTDKQKENLVIGYCPVIKTEKILHYAYPFYDLSYFDKNCGMGMMLKAIQWAQEKGLNYAYLGTCYTEASLYKTQFEGCEYFTGFSWSDNLARLKELVKIKREGHMFAEVEDKDDLLKKEGVKIG